MVTYGRLRKPKKIRKSGRNRFAFPIPQSAIVKTLANARQANPTVSNLKKTKIRLERRIRPIRPAPHPVNLVHPVQKLMLHIKLRPEIDLTRLRIIGKILPAPGINHFTFED